LRVCKYRASSGESSGNGRAGAYRARLLVGVEELRQQVHVDDDVVVQQRRHPERGQAGGGQGAQRLVQAQGKAFRGGIFYRGRDLLRDDKLCVLSNCRLPSLHAKVHVCFRRHPPSPGPAGETPEAAPATAWPPPPPGRGPGSAGKPACRVGECEGPLIATVIDSCIRGGSASGRDQNTGACASDVVCGPHPANPSTTGPPQCSIMHLLWRKCDTSGPWAGSCSSAQKPPLEFFLRFENGTLP